jgi:hypothetical protein
MRLLALLASSTLLAAVGAGQSGVPAARPVKILQAALVIETGSVLPWATLGAPYSQTLTASGGRAPYTWAVASGALPAGLILDASGLLSGTPAQGGAFNFTVTVADSSGGSASRAFSLLVVLPATPTVSITGLSDTESPAQQPELDVQLSSAYALDVTGTITLTFESNAVNPIDDPSIQFSTGGRTLNFTIPAGQTSASWNSTHAVQTGTVAGRIKLKLQYSAGGRDLTPTFAPVRSVTIALAAPQIDSVQAVKAGGGFQVLIAGYSTPRQVTNAAFTFTASQGGKSQTISVTVDPSSQFTTWYTSDTATQYGSTFLYTQPFTVQGNVSDLVSVSVTLSNATGTSAAVSADF